MKSSLGGIEFEKGVQTRFGELGWSVETTPVSGDFGADLIAQAGTEVLVIQCKDYGSPAGISAVQEIHFARSHYRASAAAVVARSGFTRAAIKAAATSDVHLFRPADLAIGSPFDRTLRRKAIERRQWAEFLAQENDRKSEIWKQYDAAMSRYNRIASFRTRLFKMLLIVGIPSILLSVFFIWNGSEYHNFPDLILLILFCIWLVYRPSLPPEPEFERRGLIVTCGTCLQKLRIDFGTEGKVRCPRCKNLMSVVSRKRSAGQRENDKDANFFG